MEFALAAGFGVIFLLIALGGLILWVYALIDAIRTPEAQLRSGSTLVWVLVILLANVVGAVIYLVIGRPTDR